MNGSPSRAIRRQAEKASATDSKLVTRGLTQIENTVPKDGGNLIMTKVERDRLSAALADVAAAFEIEDAGIRAHGFLTFDPVYRKQVEVVILQAKGVFEASQNLSNTLKIEGY